MEITNLSLIIRKPGFKAVPCCILVAIFLLTIPHFSLAYEREINTLSISIAEKIARSGKKTIAVVDFTDLQGNITELGRFLAEELSSELVSAGKAFEVVDRMHLRTILSEHKLSLTGLMDPKTVKKLGQISGVDAILIGTVTPFGESIRLSVKVLATDTAKIIGSSRGNIPKTQAIEELLAREIETGTMVAPGTTATTSPSIRRPVLKKGRAVDVGKFLVEIESLKVTSKGGLMVALAYINQTKEELEITLGYPSEEKAFATDDAGNEYTVAKSSGMARRHNDPNYDLRSPKNVFAHSSFLLCSPGERARASFLFRKSSSQDIQSDDKKLGTFTISVSHYARPTKNFDRNKPKGAFSFSATISNVHPD
ncbi:MAG: CsgG/HfaB family protein [Candidatus Omnitrophica bacterium]|nr:CsgG/HfaB family protein [Candidatus Omnitrophota bacterium]